ncbi:glycosyltransferase family 4 protein [Candidatus Daviesbacteria bacterium]|nr:glycosyltransferase family 4 protein [Candidatus Daviesbacteria bacterium]
MRIGIDARFWGPAGTGLGKYIEKLVLNLEKTDHQNDYFVFLRKNNFDLFEPRSKNFHKVQADINWYSLAEQLFMPAVIKSANLDLMHFGHFNVPLFYFGRFVVTIHDLIKSEFAHKSATIRSPIIYYLKHKAYNLVLSRAILSSAKIITPSQWVKKRILEEFSVNPDKIVVCYEATDEKLQDDDPDPQKISETLDRYQVLGQQYLIYIGNIYPHKNITRLLQAIKIIVQNPALFNLKLIIGCPRDVFWQRLAREILALDLSQVIITPGYIPAEDLAILFRYAQAYVFPSLSEGFGLPGLDAMQAGLPVVASDASCLPEIYQQAALYFDPLSIDDIADKITQILTDENLRGNLIKEGYKRAKQFSWKKMAQETLAVYQDVI